MPLFEYGCDTCGAVIEELVDSGKPEPRICGFRCTLAPGHEDRGWGNLSRQLSAPGRNVRGLIRRDNPTDDQIARAGFTKFVNQGGKLERAVGELGPKIIREDE